MQIARIRAAICGAVQGVGFRPFVFRLANELNLRGWVSNSPQGVFLEVEGPAETLALFLDRLRMERPPRSFIQSLEHAWLDPVGYHDFQIRASDSAGAKTALVLPDLATCSDCAREIFDPANRRFRYPFTNCTNCGPRFTIIEALPYDRANTSMRSFAMCELCRREYEDPTDRRFHAQPNACPSCGPQLRFWDSKGSTLAERDDALSAAVAELRAGRVVAVKSIGGFHLMVRANDDAAVSRLRERKNRERKPFALMFPAITLVAETCELSPAEAQLLQSPQAPIVLLRRRKSSALSQNIAPGNPNLGVMLPSAPLHWLLLADLGEPVVATSGNRMDEPICIDQQEALTRLEGLADFFLVHDRPILRHADDSIVRIMLGREQVLRRARGYAPLPVPIGADLPPTLAVGALLKNTVALSVGSQAFISQHIGDLEYKPSLEAFESVIKDFVRLYDTKPARISADLHTDYLSTQYAQESGLPVIQVQHHYAHVLACMAENEVQPPVLGISWDGTGLGTDRTIWGGEFLKITEDSYERVGHLAQFRLPGGDQAAKKPRRAALGLLFKVYGPELFKMKLPLLQQFSAEELSGLRRMLETGVNCPLTSSMGRLFDAVASLIGLRHQIRYEGEAAMELEFLADRSRDSGQYQVNLVPGASEVAPWVMEADEMIREIVRDTHQGVDSAIIAAKFHNSLADAVVSAARLVGEPKVVLSGGCFQNRRLSIGAIEQLQNAGFHPYWHQRVPPNDGGIALGQLVAAGRAST